MATDGFTTLAKGWSDGRGEMVFLVFGVLAFLVLRLSLRWRWRSVLFAAAAIGFLADALLEHWLVSR
jgi:hypothetical protein